VLDGVAYATLVRSVKKAPEPLTAEAEAEKPTRKPPARKGAGAVEADDEVAELEAGEIDAGEPDAEELEAEGPDVEEEDVEVDDAAAPTAAGAPAKKKTRRGSRGGKNRKKPAGTGAVKPEAAVAEPAAVAEDQVETEQPVAADEAEKKVTIHLPSDELGREGEADAAGAAPAQNGAAIGAKKKTMPGSRGRKNRRRRTAAAAASE